MSKLQQFMEVSKKFNLFTQNQFRDFLQSKTSKEIVKNAEETSKKGSSKNTEESSDKKLKKNSNSV